VRGIDYTYIPNMVDVSNMSEHFQKSHPHCKQVHNKCAKFEECHPRGKRGVDYT
jgi:hypothetical protein